MGGRTFEIKAFFATISFKKGGGNIFDSGLIFQEITVNVYFVAFGLTFCECTVCSLPAYLGVIYRYTVSQQSSDNMYNRTLLTLREN